MARRPRAKFEITAEDKTKAAFDRAERGLQSIARASAVVAGVGAALGAATVRAVGHADAIAKNAKAAGLNSDAYQELIFAGSQLGISQQSMTSNLERFTKRIGEAANGTGAAAKMYEQLGIDVTDVNGRVRSSEEVLRDVATAMQGMETDAERSAAAAALFGREGIRLGSALKDGPELLDDYARTAHELGLVLDKDLLKQAEAASDELDRMQKIAAAQATVALSQLFPIVIGVGNAFAEAAPKIRDVFDLLNQDSDLRLHGRLAMIRDRIEELQAIQANPSSSGSGVELSDNPFLSRIQTILFGGPPEEIQKELDALLGVEANMEEQIRARRAERAEAERIRQKGLIPDTPDSADNDEEGEEQKEQTRTQRLLELQQARFEALREQRLAAEGRDAELERERFERGLERLQEEQEILLESEHLSEQQKLDLRNAFRDAEEEAHAAHSARLLDIERRRAEEQKGLEDDVASERAQAARRGEAAVIASLQGLAEQSKVVQIAMLAFEKGKAIADVIVFTQVAAARALAELGPVAGPAAAAGIKAAGAASIGLIAAQGIAQAAAGGGGGGGGRSGGFGGSLGGGAGAGGAVPDGPRSLGVTERQQNVAASPVTIIVQAEGVMASSLEDFVDQAQPLIEQGVRRAVTERDVVIIEPGSRQALELQQRSSR